MLEEVYKTYKNNPPHLFNPHSKYMITGGTYHKRNYLKATNSKERLLLSLTKGSQKYHWKLEEWVILDNHYHLLLEAPGKASSLPHLINEIHKFTALWIRKHQNIRTGERIFYNYWDTCLTYEKSYFSRINYIYFNSVKHGYVSAPEKYLFGSYYYRYKEDKEDLGKLRLKYPWNRVKVQDDF